MGGDRAARAETKDARSIDEPLRNKQGNRRRQGDAATDACWLQGRGLMVLLVLVHAFGGRRRKQNNKRKTSPVQCCSCFVGAGREVQVIIIITR